MSFIGKLSGLGLCMYSSSDAKTAKQIKHPPQVTFFQYKYFTCPANWKAACMFDRKDLILMFKTRPVMSKICSNKHLSENICEETGDQLSALLIYSETTAYPEPYFGFRFH